MKKAIKGILITVGILSILGFAGCVATVFTVGDAVNTAIEEVSAELENDKQILNEILENAPEPAIEESYIGKTVIYNFTNHSDLDFDFIQLSLNVYDKDGVKLGTNSTHITDVGAGQAFKMKVELYQEGADNYDLNGFTSNIFE